jgi:hypothetical protein
MKFLIFIIYFTISFFSLYKYVNSEKIIYKDDTISLIAENIQKNHTHITKTYANYLNIYAKSSKFIYY